jgi:hypothetical protein
MYIYIISATVPTNTLWRVVGDAPGLLLSHILRKARCHYSDISSRGPHFTAFRKSYFVEVETLSGEQNVNKHNGGPHTPPDYPAPRGSLESMKFVLQCSGRNVPERPWTAQVAAPTRPDAKMVSKSFLFGPSGVDSFRPNWR